MWGIGTYGGEDSPVLGGEVAEGFGVELHGAIMRNKGVGEVIRLTGVL